MALTRRTVDAQSAEMKQLLNLHPGTALREDYLPELEMTEYRLAKELRITQSHLRQLLRCERSVTANMALRLGKLFDQTPQFWLNMQNHFDLRVAMLQYGNEINAIEPLSQRRKAVLVAA